MLPGAICNTVAGQKRMTAKSWCAISKAIDIIKTAQNSSEGHAQAWLIEACAGGNIRSRVPALVDATSRVKDDGLAGSDLRPGNRLSLLRKRAPGPVSADVWADAFIDADALIDVDLSVPTYESLKKIYPRLVPGGAIYVDDCPEGNHWKARAGYAQFMGELGQPEIYEHGLGILYKAA